MWLGRGDIWHFGNATFTALHPGEHGGRVWGPSGQKRVAGAFLSRRMTFAGVFTGDIGAAQEEEILTWLQKTKNGAGVQKIDFYKAAHHGSRSIPPGFWRRWHRRSHWCRAAEQTGTDTPSARLSGICAGGEPGVLYDGKRQTVRQKDADGQAVCRGVSGRKRTVVAVREVCGTGEGML